MVKIRRNITVDESLWELAKINLNEPLSTFFQRKLEEELFSEDYSYFLEKMISKKENEIKILKKELDRIKNEEKLKNENNRKTIRGKVRLEVFERDNYQCQVCGATIGDGVKLHIDHIVPVSKGGTDDIDNLQVLCDKCNLSKSNRLDLTICEK